MTDKEILTGVKKYFPIHELVGKGNFIELAISWLHKPLKNRISYDMFTLGIKGIVLFISIVLCF